MTYAAPAPAPAPPPAVTRRSTRGAKILTAVGALLCVAAVVLGVFTARQFVGLLPLDLLGPDGSAGSAVVGTVDAPGTAQVQLEAGRYAILIAQREPAGLGELAGDLEVTGPDGTSVATGGGAQVSVNAGRGGVRARSVGAFVVAEPGSYTVTAPPLTDGSTATVMLTPDQDFVPFFTGIFSTVFGVFGVMVVGFVGFGMTVGGIVWWAIVRRPRPASR
ncbi:hypothetical protein [Pengzhenrongella frigida]|uniref:Uncharacterized protein n=1 Tax=Pengzhenrongella frigida TaxID=1259133 RepID=A0A4Q5MWM7_9MICO|nr:hypothetical protein [Cellulomonas sp. HLT2-17]RYV49965.1 hypothetical protein EUA98_16155 [Cellulomonas sp. HLT2-17]